MRVCDMCMFKSVYRFLRAGDRLCAHCKVARMARGAAPGLATGPCQRFKLQVLSGAGRASGAGLDGVQTSLGSKGQCSSELASA